MFYALVKNYKVLTMLFEDMPENLTYLQIQPILIDWVLKEI